MHNIIQMILGFLIGFLAARAAIVGLIEDDHVLFTSAVLCFITWFIYMFTK